MKKLIATLTSLFVLVSLTACGGSGSSAAQSGAPAPVVSSSAKSKSEASPQPKAEEAVVEKQVLVDQEGIKITATDLDLKGFMGPELKVLIENQGDTDVTVQVRDMSVNGYMVGTSMSSEVAAGKKVNDSITFLKSDMETCGISAFADIEFRFHIFTSEDWSTVLDTDLIQVQTSLAGTYAQTYDDSGEIVLDQDGIKIVYKGMEDSLMGPSMVFYIENNTDTKITVQQRSMSIDGFMIDGIFSPEVMPGKRAVHGITIFNSDLEENGIETPVSAELSFHIFQSDNMQGILDSDMITLTL